MVPVHSSEYSKKHKHVVDHPSMKIHNELEIKEKSTDGDDEMTLTDKAEIVLSWSWEVRDIVSLIAEIGTLILVQHLLTWAMVLGLGSIMIGIFVMRIKAKKHKHNRS